VHQKGTRGSETFYPPGTGDQLLLICELRWKRKIKRLRDIGWCLWWCGSQVDRKFWRSRLENHAVWFDREWPKIARRIFDRDGTISESGLRFFGKFRSPDIRTKSAPFRQLRKRTKTGDWETFLSFLFEIAAGRFKRWDNTRDPTGEDLKSDKRIVDHGFGFDRARTDRIGEGRPWLEGDIDEPLVRLSQAIAKGRRLAAVLASTSAAGRVPPSGVGAVGK